MVAHMAPKTKTPAAALERPASRLEATTRVNGRKQRRVVTAPETAELQPESGSVVVAHEATDDESAAALTAAAACGTPHIASAPCQELSPLSPPRTPPRPEAALLFKLLKPRVAVQDLATPSEDLDGQSALTTVQEPPDHHTSAMDEAMSIFREARGYRKPLLPWGATGK